MKIRKLIGVGAAVSLVAVLAGTSAFGQSDSGRHDPGASHKKYDVLVFSKTAGFRHSSIPVGQAAIKELGADNGFRVTVSEDAATFNDADLRRYEAVVFLSTTGDVLDPVQQASFERYINRGGGYVGVHAASDTEYDWPWYGALVGAYFNGHPAQQDAVVEIEDSRNPSTRGLPWRWERFDEWYNFRSYTDGSVHVLARLDETTYDPGPTAMGADHPIAWCQEFDGGRSWYTGMGHTEESYADPLFLSHLLGGIEQVAGAARFACR